MTVRIVTKGSGLYKQKMMHTLIVNDTERFRLMVGNQLKYAKGKINFDLNWPILGDGKTHPTHKSDDSRYPEYYVYNGGGYVIPKSLYAFYEDGFYIKRTYSWDKSFDRYKEQNLSNLYPFKWTRPDWAKEFKGWFTAKEGGRKIDTIKQVNDLTDLFKYKEENSLPEITLYAQWDIHMYTITVRNISRSGRGVAKSSCIYKGKRTDNFLIDTFKVPILTEAISYVNERIKDPKYVTWAYRALDGTKQQEALRKGPQKFLGWSSDDDKHSGTLVYTKFVMEEDLVLYPQFEMIAIWRQSEVKKKKYGGVFKLYANKKEWDGYGHKPGFKEGVYYDYVLLYDLKEPKIPRQYFDKNNCHHSFSWQARYSPYQETFWHDADPIFDKYMPLSSTYVFTLTDTKEYN